MASHGRGRGVRRNFEAGKETKVRKMAKWGEKNDRFLCRLARGERRGRMRGGGEEREERREAELLEDPQTRRYLKASESLT